MISKSKTKKSIKKKTEQLYCKRCGAQIKPHFKIQLTSRRMIDVCFGCFDWSMDKTPAEILKDYKERNKRKIK